MEIKYMAVGEDKEMINKHAFKVLSMATDLHASLTEAPTRLGDDEKTLDYHQVFFYVEILEARLRDWDPSRPGCEEYDAAVKRILEIAVDEGRGFLAKVVDEEG